MITTKSFVSSIVVVCCRRSMTAAVVEPVGLKANWMQYCTCITHRRDCGFDLDKITSQRIIQQCTTGISLHLSMPFLFLYLLSLWRKNTQTYTVLSLVAQVSRGNSF